jgi:hypothetical protein
MDEKGKNKMELKPYTLGELSRIYGVDHRTFQKWIRPFADEIGKRTGWFYSIPQVKLIFQKLQLPSIIDTE